MKRLKTQNSNICIYHLKLNFESSILEVKEHIIGEPQNTTGKEEIDRTLQLRLTKVSGLS